MQFDDMKSAWQTLDRRLEQQHALNLQMFRDSRTDKARSGLRPLFRGQIVQIFYGMAMILLGVSVWSSHAESTQLLVSGVIVHVYGVVAIMLAGITLGMIRRLDYSAPVLAIQKQLAQLRSFYVRSGMIVGLSWWLFWIPFVACFFAWLAGVDLFANMGGAIGWSVAVGMVGLLATWGFHRWAERSGHSRWVKAMNDSMGGSSLRKAQAVLDEIKRFEQ
ncbi:MAG TPA: serine/threonine protein kinase [Dokdonella sp.]|uniref:serine/threonine protein kinase n=1 Tax=Dokdonella sp. TaxID=2291710 RepID=UPI002D7F4B6D|nr:serine/threonine protein kinase [Dokdonella sp.]HET9031383.1 serine/threonine protein kinase [Dokdonella sp.]